MGSRGGVGVTTVTAQLACALASRQEHVIAIDLSHSNSLRLHLGMPLDDPSGIAPQVLAGNHWSEAAYRSPGGVDFVPFGKVGRLQLRRFTEFAEKQPAWFSGCLELLDQPSDVYVLCDCAQAVTVFQTQAIEASQIVLTVLDCDPVSFVKLNLSELIVGSDRLPETRLLVNQFDATRDLDRDVLALIRAEFNQQTIPVMIHRDENVREALASKRDIFTYAPSSQAATDYVNLSMWLTEHFAVQGSS